jgi:hypothetical protein
MDEIKTVILMNTNGATKRKRTQARIFTFLAIARARVNIPRTTAAVRLKLIAEKTDNWRFG